MGIRESMISEIIQHGAVSANQVANRLRMTSYDAKVIMDGMVVKGMILKDGDRYSRKEVAGSRWHKWDLTRPVVDSFTNGESRNTYRQVQCPVKNVVGA